MELYLLWLDQRNDKRSLVGVYSDLNKVLEGIAQAVECEGTWIKKYLFIETEEMNKGAVKKR